MDEALKQIRHEIDCLDEAILLHLSERAKLAHRIGQLKNGDTTYRPEREAQVLKRIADLNQGPLGNANILCIFREIMSACLALEEPLKIAYLGPAGTFTERAAKKQFGLAPTFFPLPSIDEVFRAVESGNADYGVAPVENSTEGAVGHTLDLLLATPLKICSEVMLRIHHHLLSQSDSLSDSGIQCIYSHAQSFSQCHDWLNHNVPQLSLIPVASNAEAARLAAANPQACAIAGETAAELYGLNILAQNIEDDSNNTTRFLVLGSHDIGPSGNDKTSLVCSAQNKPGAVHDLLEPLAEFGVSMTKFESRPSRTGLWEYVFYIDLEGHPQDAAVAQALEKLQQRAGFLKVLGAYPVALL